MSYHNMAPLIRQHALERKLMFCSMLLGFVLFIVYEWRRKK